MTLWGLRCFPSNGERSAVVVLAGPSPEERREVGRLVLDAGEIEDLRGRLADRPSAEEHAALARYHDALASGLSDYEAREEGWPTGSADQVQRHLADEWHRDQCGCDTWPTACATYPPFDGSSLGHAPQTWSVDDVLLAAAALNAPRGSVQPVSYVAEALARVDAKPWPPTGYLCLVKGNDGCPGHPSKWMVCPDDGDATESIRSTRTEETQ